MDKWISRSGQQSVVGIALPNSVLTLFPLSPDKTRVEECCPAPSSGGSEYNGNGGPKAVTHVSNKRRGYGESECECHASAEAHEMIALCLCGVVHVRAEC